MAGKLSIYEEFKNKMPDPPTEEEIQKMKEEAEAQRKRDYLSGTKTPRSIVVPIWSKKV